MNSISNSGDPFSATKIMNQRNKLNMGFSVHHQYVKNYEQID